MSLRARSVTGRIEISLPVVRVVAIKRLAGAAVVELPDGRRLEVRAGDSIDFTHTLDLTQADETVNRAQGHVA